MKYLIWITVILLFQSCKYQSKLDEKFSLKSWHNDLEELSKNDEIEPEQLFKLECIIRFHKQRTYFDTTKPITYRQLLGVGFNFHGLEEDKYISTGPKGIADFHLNKGTQIMMKNTENSEKMKFSETNLIVRNHSKESVLVSRVVLWSETIHGIYFGSPVYEINRIIEPTSTDTIHFYYDEPSIMSNFLGDFPEAELLADKQIIWDNFNLLLQQVNFDTIKDDAKKYQKEDFYFHSGAWEKVSESPEN